MAVIVLTCAAGSPGVTTAALGLALTWPRPVVLVDADPTGGSAVLAGYFHGDVAHTGGLIDLALAHRDGTLAQALPAAMMPIPDTDVLFLPGVRAHTQAAGLAGLWAPLGAALAGLETGGQDVLVDAGRLGLDGAPGPLLAMADVALLTTRTSLPALSAARSWAVTLREVFERAGGAVRLGVLLVGPGRPYTSREVCPVLGLPVTATLPWDPPGAAVFSEGAAPPRRFETSALVRGLRAAAAGVQAALAAHRADLATNPSAADSFDTSVGSPA